MKLKKSFILILFFSICISIYFLFITNTAYKEKQFTYDEKTEDAKFLLNFLESNYPFFDLKKDLTGYDFLKHKEELIDRIRNSKDNNEFYFNIYRTLKLLQNSHTRLADNVEVTEYINSKNFTSDNKYPYINKYSSTLNNDITKNNINWDDKFLSMYYIPDIMCSYIEGKYIVIQSFNKNINIGDEVIQIQGQSVEEYLKHNIDIYTLFYDYKRGKLFTDKLFMFPSLKKIKNIPITTLNSNNVEKQCKIYMKKYNSEDYNKLMKNSNEPINTDIYTKIIEPQNIAYMKINAMTDNNGNIEHIKNFFESIENYKYLIIDIRGNKGGGGTIPDVIISYISKNPSKLIDYLYFKENDYTKEFVQKVFKEPSSIILNTSNIPGDLNKNKYICIENVVTHSFNKDHNFRGKVFLLVDYKVYSYSEYLANHISRLKLATIVGTNTGGDGITVSPHINKLPNSNLSFKLSIALGTDNNGNINEKLHTVPDYYVEQGLEDYRNFIKNNINNIETTKYDTIFNKCINLIKSN